MTSLKSLWIASCLISVITRDIGVCGRAVDSLSRPPNSAAEPGKATLRAGAPRRWRRGAAEAHRERCAELAAPWTEGAHRAAGDNGTTLLQLRARPFSPGAARGSVFPEKPLFGFVRRVYRCCQEKVNCRSVRGIQGRTSGDRDVEFVLTREILSLAVRRAELHLHLSNPQHLDIQPVLPYLAKRDLPTRYSLGSRGDTVELRVDLLFLIQRLQEAAAAAGAGRGPGLAGIRRTAFFSDGSPPGETPSLGRPQDAAGNELGAGVADTLPALDLGLVLDCGRAGSGVSCGAGGVHLLHTPFMALYYR